MKDNDKVLIQELKKQIKEEILKELEDKQKNVVLKVKKLPNFSGGEIKYQTPGSVGLDLRASIVDPNTKKPATITILPGCVEAIPLGIAVQIPDGYEMQIRTRSSLSLTRITVENSPGTIDQDFRNQLMAIIANDRIKPYSVENGDRICQAIIAPAVRCKIEYVDELSETERGANGFGSTGLK